MSSTIRSLAAGNSRLSGLAIAFTAIFDVTKLQFRTTTRDLVVHPRQRDREIDRLRHVVVGADFHRFDDVLRLAVGSRHDDGQKGGREFLANPTQDLRSIHIRHRHVEKHDVDMSAPERASAPPRRNRPRRSQIRSSQIGSTAPRDCPRRRRRSEAWRPEPRVRPTPTSAPLKPFGRKGSLGFLFRHFTLRRRLAPRRFEGARFDRRGRSRLLEREL